MTIIQTIKPSGGIKFEEPTFDYMESKWTTFRQNNCDQVAEEFKKSSNRVDIFSDVKFGSEPLVLLRKTKLDSFIKFFRDLSNGQAFVRHNIDILLSATTILNNRIKEKNIKDTEILESLKILLSVSGQIKTEVVISSNRGEIKKSMATSEELEGLPKD